MMRMIGTRAMGTKRVTGTMGDDKNDGTRERGTRRTTGVTGMTRDDGGDGDGP